MVVVVVMIMMTMTKDNNPLKFYSLNTVFKALRNVASANLISSSYCFPTQMVYPSGHLPLCLSLCLGYLAFLLYLMWHGHIFSLKLSFSVPISLAFSLFCPGSVDQHLLQPLEHCPTIFYIFCLPILILRL